MQEDICRSWCGGDPLLEEYHDREWCKIHHDDRFQFEMLCLEGASTGLSWKIILHKRAAYRAAFHDFDIAACAEMPDSELEEILSSESDFCVVRNRSKVYSVRRNARVVKSIQAEFGSFDAYLWNFAGHGQIDGSWLCLSDVPVSNDVSRRMSRDMKRRGMAYVGETITYSFMQSIGIVNDHLAGCRFR